MEKSPLERAARAAMLHLTDEGGMPFEAGDAVPPSAHAIARAVLQAIREPSAEMRGAGMEITLHVSPNESDEGYREDAAMVWRTMIDAALEEG